MQGEESEQLFLNLEQRHFSLKREHEAVCSERDAVKDKVTNLERSLEESRNIAEKLQKEIISKDTELIQKNNIVKEYAQVKEEANERLKRRADECERLREDLKSQADELTTLRSRNRENQNILADTQAQLMPIQFELTKATRENDSLKNRVADLENNVSVLQQESANIRRVYTKKVFDLESSVAEKSAVIDEYSRKIKSSQDQLTLRNEAVEEYSTRLKESENRLAEQESTFVQELDGLKKMVDIYKHHFEEATNRVEELETTANQANDVIATQLTQVKNKYLAEIELLRNKWNKEKEEKENKIQQLELRLQNHTTQQQQSQIQSQQQQLLLLSSPTSDFIPSPVPPATSSSTAAVDADFFSLSTSEMYYRVVTAERSRVLEISKRREVELYLDRVLKDVEAKAPLIANQKRDYNRVLESHTQLTQRLDDLSHENAQLKHIAKQWENKTKQAGEEVLVYKQQNTDLSSQLQHLLKKYYEAQYGSMSSTGGSGGSSSKPVVALIGYGDDSSSSSSSAVVPPTPEDVISNFLVTFDDIKELQTRNAQLLQVVRKLSLEQERDLVSQQQQQQQQEYCGDESNSMMMVDSCSSGSDAQQQQALKETSAALTDALKELSSLREARQRTEGMVVGLVQQRDMYKAMVEEMNGSMDFRAKTSAITASATTASATSASSFEGSIQSPVAMGRGGNGSSNSSAAAAVMETTPVNVSSSIKRVTELQSQLTQLQEENRRLNERMTRLNESEQLVNQSLDTVKQENIVLRLESSKNASEAKFQKERSERLEESLKQSQLEISTTCQRKLEVEKELIETQRNARVKEDTLFQNSMKIKSYEDSVRRLEMDIEVSKASEQRLMQQLSDQREESRRQLSLTESIQRIEMGLSSRVEEEKAVLQQERDSLSRSLETVRKQMNQRELVDDQRIRSLEEDVKSLQQRLNEKSDQYGAVQQELTREQVTCEAAQERASLLEKQLSVVNERLTSIHDANTLDSILQNTISEQEIALEKTQAEIETLKSQLLVSESHAEQFRLISSATEKTLKEMSEQSKTSRLSYETELMKIQVTVTSLQEELTTQRAATTVALKEVEEARQQLRDMPKQHAVEIKLLQHSLTASDQAKNEASNQVTQLKLDVIKYQEAARKSYTNYERELQLHAEAEKSRHALEIDRDEIKQQLVLQQERNAELSAASIRREQVLLEEKNKLNTLSQEHKVEIEGLRKTNELLHGQVQSLGVQVDRLLESRGGSGVSTVSGVVAEGGVGGSSSSTGSSVEPSSSSTSSTASSTTVDEELKELHNTSSELREVVRYIKRERDILEAKLSVAETENNRYSHTIQSLQRSVDEIKSELKREVEKRVTVHTEDEFSRLMTEVNQLNLIRESNAHLRYENEELSKKVQLLSIQLDKEIHDNAPLKEQIRLLTAEKEGLETSNQGLLNDTNYWRERLHQLVSRYNDVDPEEHRLLQEKCSVLTTQIDELNTALELAAKSCAEAMLNKDKELSSLKSSYDKLDQNSLLLRDKMRVLKTKFDEQVKKSSDFIKQNNELKMEVQKLTNDFAVATSAASRVEAELQQRIEKLTQESIVLTAKAASQATATVATSSTTTATTAPPAAVPTTEATSTALITTTPTPVPAAPAEMPATVATTAATTTITSTAAPAVTTTTTATAPVAATSGEERMKAMREMLLLKQAQRESSSSSATTTTNATPAVAISGTAAVAPTATIPALSSIGTSAVTSADTVTVVDYSSPTQQATKKARFAEDVDNTVVVRSEESSSTGGAATTAIQTVSSASSSSSSSATKSLSPPTAITATGSSSSSSSSSSFSSLISNNSMNPFAKPFQFTSATGSAMSTGDGGATGDVTTVSGGSSSIFGFKSTTTASASPFTTTVTSALAPPSQQQQQPYTVTEPAVTTAMVEEGEEEGYHFDEGQPQQQQEGEEEEGEVDEEEKQGEGVDETMLMEENNSDSSQPPSSQHDEEEAEVTQISSSTPSSSSTTTAAVINNNNGPFLNLRPPSPSQTNKHLIPVFGLKKSATTATTSSVVPSLTLPSTSSTAVTSSPFGLLTTTNAGGTIGTTGISGGGIFGTTGQQQPKIMSSSIFGNAAAPLNTSTIAPTGFGTVGGATNAPSLLVPSSTSASALTTGASFGSLLAKASTNTAGTSGGIFGTGASITPSPFASSSSSSLFGMSSKPATTASPFSIGDVSATTATSQHPPFGSPSLTTATTVAGESTEEGELNESASNSSSATTGTGAATVKLIGKQQPLSVEEQKRRRMEKFASGTGSSGNSTSVAIGTLAVPRVGKRKQQSVVAASQAQQTTAVSEPGAVAAAEEGEEQSQQQQSQSTARTNEESCDNQNNNNQEEEA